MPLPTRAWCANTEQIVCIVRDQVKPAVGIAQGTSIDVEAGKYEYDPSAIAVQDAVVMVDKPEAQTGKNQAANSFNFQYETVRHAVYLYICFLPLIATWCIFQ